MRPVYLPDDRAFLRYLEIPGGDPPLLWLHGWQCSSTGELLPAAVQTPLRGRRSLLIDFLGHGYSDKPPDFGYSQTDHARTIIALIDAMGLTECGLVGHSMGGAIAIRVAAARPGVVSLLILAEANIDAWGVDEGVDEDPPLNQSEDEFVAEGFAALLARQASVADADRGGMPAAHVGITALVSPRAIYREAVALRDETDPSIRVLLRGLTMPRWYLQGARSDPDPELERDLVAMGVRWQVVPDTGHAMGLQNPSGVAEAVAQAVQQSWRT
jgi:pimeloyl-ACP methyl ester carboxylesterase